MKIPDSHAHLTDPKFDPDREEVIERARREGVWPIMVPCSPGEFPLGKKLAEKFPFIHLALGIHPHDAKTWDLEKRRTLEREAYLGKIRAIGEIGLDYHYNFSPPGIQRDVLRFQMEIAEKYSLPVIIHSRESAADMGKIIEEFNVRGVLHSFSEEKDLAELALSRGYFISFSGMLTFSWGKEIRALAAEIPLERVLVETDSPYLAPVPWRGRRNEPAFVKKVAERLAELRGMSLEKLAVVLEKNYFALFGGENGKFEKEDKGN